MEDLIVACWFTVLLRDVDGSGCRSLDTNTTRVKHPDSFVTVLQSIITHDRHTLVNHASKNPWSGEPVAPVHGSFFAIVHGRVFESTSIAIELIRITKKGDVTIRGYMIEAGTSVGI